MIMESGFSSPRTEAFPAGLRVLVVDDDPTWLKILEKMLKKCSYEVTTCGLAREALRLLRDRKDGFDIVISDVNMPDMDGFRLLEHVGLEMDLPVIMMSVDGETSRVMKGVQHGACDYLLKPIRMKELKNIWQHVIRKRLHEVRDIEFIEDSNGTDHSNNGHYGGDQTLLKKRKDVDDKHDEKESSDPSSTKKARVVWTIELHQKFVKAVNQIGIDSDKVGPKKILDLMNVSWLTRENVASHLQKYRLYLSRIRKEDNIECSFGGMKNLEHSPKESSGSISLQNSSLGQQNDVTSNYVYPGNHLPVQTMDIKPLDKDLKIKTEHRKRFNNENSDPQRTSNPQAGPNHTFRSPQTGMNYASFNSPCSGQYPWTGEVSDLHFKPEFKPHPKVEDCFNQPTVPILQQQIKADLLDPAPLINPGPSISERDNFSLIDMKPLNDMQDGIRKLSPTDGALGPFCVSNPDAFGCVFDMSMDMKKQDSSQDRISIKEQPPLKESIFSVHPESDLSDRKGLQPNFDVAVETKEQSSTSQGGIIGPCSVNGLETELSNQALGTESAFGLLGEDIMSRWLQGGDGPYKDVGFDCVGLSEFNFPEHVEEPPLSPYVPKFGLDYEYPFDWTEYPVVDQGLLFS